VRPISPERLQKNVGQRLAESRKLRGLTQQVLADRLGVTMRYVQAVEAGGENLTLRSLAEWANVLKVTPSVLFETPAPSVRKPGRPRTKTT